MRQRLMMLPFAYALRYIPHRRRNETTRLVRGDMPVRVRECEGAEAPVGIALVRHDHYRDTDDAGRARYYPDGPPVSEFRYIDGVPLSPLGGGRSGLDAGVFETSVAKPADQWVEWGFAGPAYKPGAGWSGEGYPRMPWYRAPGSMREIRSPMELPTADEFVAHAAGIGEPVRVRGDDRAACEAVAGPAMGDRLAVVDGEVWKAEPGLEPHWEVIEGGDHRVRVELILARDPLAYVHRFRLDRLEEARAFARERAGALGREFVDTRAEARISVPSVLRMDEAVETARQILCHLDWPGGDPGRGVAEELGRMAGSMTATQAGETLALVEDAGRRGVVEIRDALRAALNRLADMAKARPELVQEVPRDDEILAGLGR